MKVRIASRLAWALLALTVWLFVLALVGGLEATPTFTPLSVQVQVWAIALLSAAFLTFAVVGALIAATDPTNKMGWLFMLMGASVGVTMVSIVYVELDLPARGWAEWAADLSSVGVFPQIVFVLLLFPDGKLPSPKWRVVAWAGAMTAAGLALGTFTPYTPPDRVFSNPVGIEGLRGTILEHGALGWILLPFTMMAAAAAFVVRFRGSDGQHRQQLKWFALAVVIVAAGFLGWLATWGVIALSLLPRTWDTILTAAGMLVLILGLMTVPVASGVAILRYRLYDIDVIINRAVVYVVLTAALVTAYVGGVVGVSATVRTITRQESNSLAVAASTLGVAALFRPLRRRVQSFIDRRFYRDKYDAQQTLDDFAARLRDQVDLESLNTELANVVCRTMQPTHVSLWLKNPQGTR